MADLIKSLRLPFTPCLLAFLLASASVAPVASAQTDTADQTALTVLGIDDLVTLALQHNPGLKASQRGIDIATAAITTASALPNPRLEIGGGRNTTALGASQAGNVASIGVSQFIENPSVRNARIHGALFAEQGSQQSLALARNELVAQVRLRVYEYVLRREEAQAATDALLLLEQTRERIKVRVDSGEAGKYELIKADAEIVNARQREETAKLQISQAAITLNRLAAGMLPARWELDAELEESDNLPSLDALKQAALRNNPELRVLQAEFDRQQSRIDEATASRLPGLELRLSQVREPDVRQDMVGVSVQIPLLDQKRGPRAEAIAERERTLVRLEGRRAELMQQLELAWHSVEIARVRIQALAEGAVRSSEAALRVSEAAYRYGERGILEVLDAQRVLRAVRQDLLLARFQLKSSLIELDALAGRYASAR